MQLVAAGLLNKQVGGELGNGRKDGQNSSRAYDAEAQDNIGSRAHGRIAKS